MNTKQLKKVACEIEDFLEDRNIENNVDTIFIEKEWTDFCVILKDQSEAKAQMKRIDTWLQDDLKQAIKDWSNIQISAPRPIPGKENELRVRIYGQN